MFVSTSRASLVQVLPRPSAVFRGVDRTRPLALALAGGRLVEQGAPGFDIARRGPGGRHDVDHVARRLPLDVVARSDPEAIGDRLGNRDLSLARDLGHILTTTRIAS